MDVDGSVWLSVLCPVAGFAISAVELLAVQAVSQAFSSTYVRQQKRKNHNFEGDKRMNVNSEVG